MFAQHIVYYGINYRIAFEKHLKINKSIDINFALSTPDSILVFICLSGLTGIIGNAAYDLVKKAVGKIVAQKKEGNKYDYNNEKIEMYFHYMKDFLTGLKGVDEEVKKEILHEMATWHHTENYMNKSMNNSDLENKYSIKEETHIAKSTTNETNRNYKVINRYPEQKNFEGYWENLKK